MWIQILDLINKDKSMAKKIETVANYKDPAPGKFGWGEEELSTTKKRVAEQASRDLPNVGKIVMTAGAAKGASLIESDVEDTLRAKMKFDEGWSFLVAEAICQGFGELETWMARQLVGNCVGDSHCGLILLRISHEILAEGDAEEPLGKLMLGSPFIPYSYGVGRWEGDMLGPGDGSYCGAQMEGTLKHGFLPCFTEGLDKYTGSGDAAFPQGTASANRLFGKSKAEIEKWTSKAVHFKMAEAPVAENADQAKVLMVEKFTPLQICSDWAFKYKGFDEKYQVHVYTRDTRDSWSHSMQLVAMFAIKGQWFVTTRNQWGKDAHKGSPEIGLPPGTFTITFEEFAKWVKDSETMGIGEIQGMPSNPGF